MKLAKSTKPPNGKMAKRVTLYIIRIGRRMFYNTWIHRLPFVSSFYERLFHFSFDRNSLVEVSYNGILIQIPGKDITILPSMLNHTYETNELRLVENLLRPGMIFIDVGANVGIYSLIAARSVAPDGLVYSFEPAPENFEILIRNFEINHLANVVTERMAVGDKTSTSVLHLVDNSVGTHSLLERRGGSRADQEIQVEVVTLDGYFEGRMPSIVDMIKVDVEGYETQVLSGATKILGRTNYVLIEYNRDVIMSQYTVDQFIEFLADFPFLYGFDGRSGAMSVFSKSQFALNNYMNLLASKKQVNLFPV